MKARDERPALVYGEGTRVVLIAHKSSDRAQLSSALNSIARQGWNLITIVEPDRPTDALRLLLDGAVDALVATRREFLPAMYAAGDLSRDRSGPVTPTVQPWRTTGGVRRARTAGVEPSPNRPDRPQLLAGQGNPGPALATTEGRRNRRPALLKSSAPPAVFEDVT